MTQRPTHVTTLGSSHPFRLTGLIAALLGVGVLVASSSGSRVPIRPTQGTSGAVMSVPSGTGPSAAAPAGTAWLPAPRSESALSATAPALCREAGRLERLIVVRRDAFPSNHIRYTFPSVMSAEDVASIRGVARTLCTLEAFPNGVIHCPIDLGITYYLGFFTATGPVPPWVRVDATGCRGVTGVGPVRWGSETLMRRLEGALQLPSGAFDVTWP
jgi:hypothetical protein